VRAHATLALVALAAALGAAGGRVATPSAQAPTFRELADAARATLVGDFYAGQGRWRTCLAPGCSAVTSDWGADSLTYALYMRWEATHDRGLMRIFREIAAHAPRYGACRGHTCRRWSDVPEWDAIAAVRDFQVTGDRAALVRAEAGFWSVERSDAYALGACSDVNYQRPFGAGGGLKTLETDANAVKAALLLYGVTHDGRYLRVAERRYAAIRRHFLDGAVPLYTVYVLDDRARCTQIPHRFFASVNGTMAWSGVWLAALTGKARYRAQAVATAHAVSDRLADGRGIYANLQAENDVSEPLVEAMAALAPLRDGSGAATWIVRNAEAMVGARGEDGAYARFFDGPAPQAAATAWQANGSLALAFVAGHLAPAHRAGYGGAWPRAQHAAFDISELPAQIRFHGSGIALMGSLGEACCERGHARVLVDGIETFDGTGIWQNKSSANRTFRNALLFAWRWPTSSDHTIDVLPGEPNPKEGGAFAHITQELVVP
jgi:hypothetical protein